MTLRLACAAALFFAPVAGLFTGCAGGNPKALEAGPDEVVVVGRIHAYEKGMEVSPGLRLLFNESVAGFYRTFTAKDSGYFVLRLPRGKNRITHLEYEGRSVTFSEEYAVLELSEAGRIHYIGDIVIVLASGQMEVAGGGAAGLGAVGGLVGVAAGAVIDHMARDLKDPSDFVPVTFEISSDPLAARAFLRRKYKVDSALLPSLLKVLDGAEIQSEVLETGDVYESE